jgi:hypothetical protein
VPSLFVGAAISAAVSAVVGAVAGGLAGKNAALAAVPTAEEMYWRDAYVREPYYEAGRNFEYYASGFRAGWMGRVRHDGRSFNEAEPELIAEFFLGKTDLDPAWHDVRAAAHAAWDRVDRQLNGDPTTA